MAYSGDHGYFEAKATHNGGSEGIVSNRVKVLDNSDEVDIRVSMFFDGTGNNMYNIDARKENEKRKAGETYDSTKAWADRLNMVSNDSFKSDYSNVARLFTNYKKEENAAKIATAEYVEGIATKKHRPDIPMPAASFGSGFRGITDKVTDGCNQVADRIKDVAGKSKIILITFDVFGFSRGAAAARQFIYEINKPADTIKVQNGPRSFQDVEIPARGDLGVAFQDRGIVYDGEIKVQFAGLFDTVPSYRGLSKIVLDQVTEADDVLHLTAMDERRVNFALVNVASKGLQYEKELPGVHSDVGGSYLEEEEETDRKIFYQTQARSAEKEIEYLIEDGWYKDKSFLTIDTSNMGTYIKGTKTVKNHYSFIPLHIMKKKALCKPNEIKFIERTLNDNFRIPEDLTKVDERIDEFVFKKGKPMRFYTIKELIADIKRELSNDEFDILLDKMHSRSGEPDAAYKDYIRGKIPKQWEPAYRYSFNQFMNENINEDDFIKYPELQQKIKDRNQLKYLRLNYFHTSHKCMPTDDMVDYMNPFKTSVRDMPSREIISDTQYRK